jgi:tetratricopeptide (TPR) repeat protein
VAFRSLTRARLSVGTRVLSEPPVVARPRGWPARLLMWLLATVLFFSFLARSALAAELPAAPTGPRQALQTGDYKDAVARLQRAVRQPGVQPRVRAELVDLYLLLGWYDDAQRSAEEWLSLEPAEPLALLSRAKVAYARGELGLAETVSRQAVTSAPQMLAARVELVEVLLAQGHGKEAADEAGAFPQRLATLIDAEKGQLREDVSAAVLVDVAKGCALYGVAREESAALKLAVQELYPEVRRRNPQELRAYVEPADLLLAKFNLQEARQLYEQALEINPNSPEAHLGLARCHWEANELEEARTEVGATLAVNPHHPEALALQARLDLAEGRADAARESIEQALAVNPNLGEAWGLRLILSVGAGEPKGEPPSELVALPTPAQACAYRELGDWLSDRRRYAEAEVTYQRSLLVASTDPAALASLGLCYFRWGREPEARKNLEEAFRHDSFNVRVYNALNVLDLLSTYSETRRGDLVVRAPKEPQTARASGGRAEAGAPSPEVSESPLQRARMGEAARFATYVTSQGAEALTALETQLQVKLEQPVVVEVFPTRDLFSARVSALPGLEAEAASLGPVVALLTPGAAQRPFNWCDALLHELAHAVSYVLAEGHVPQWLEEGLAFWAEGVARPRDWCLVLDHAAQSPELLALADLDGAFVAPPGSTQRSLAYAQSSLAFEFLLEHFGWEKVRALLAGAKSSEGWPQALAAALAVSPEELEAGYRKYLEERCRELHTQLALASTLAEEWEKTGALSPGSSQACVQVLRTEPAVLDLPMLRHLAAQAADPALSEEALWALVAVEPTDVESALTLADRLSQAGRRGEAEVVYRFALGAGLDDPRVHVALADVALEAGRREEAFSEAEAGRQMLEGNQGRFTAAVRGRMWQTLANVFSGLGKLEQSQRAQVRAQALTGRRVGASGRGRTP